MTAMHRPDPLVKVCWNLARPQLDRLRAESRALGISVSEIIRRAVDEHFRQEPTGRSGR